MKKLVTKPVITVISHTRKGDKVTTISEKNLVYGLLTGALLVAVFNIVPDQLNRWEKREKVEALQPAMQRLASAGRPEAKLWLTLHADQINRPQLAALAAQGLPEAMYAHGWLLRHDGKPDGAGWIARAAAAGWVPALEDLDRHAKGA
ncbi:hypothetical protein ACFFU8_09560 [Chromobacterium piscinae]|uniref:hypothetical protein n=1 Tax=Chromobacterium piscinae TaxID=686831 RepID=UPI001E5974E9|nr:hypothetical protein [Chromobacterium piscinae]MCD5327849.1 hypothetical protein [Chromobacterium piscinae]